jgi:hypothetical protein
MSESLPGQLEEGRQKLIAVAGYTMDMHAHAAKASKRYRSIANKIGELLTELSQIDEWQESRDALEASIAAHTTAREARDILSATLAGTQNPDAIDILVAVSPLVHGRDTAKRVFADELGCPSDSEVLSPTRTAIAAVRNHAAILDLHIQHDRNTYAELPFTIAERLEAYVSLHWPDSVS